MNAQPQLKSYRDFWNPTGGVRLDADTRLAPFARCPFQPTIL
jgi:hypothetical protein